ncbi:TonB-dependent receptor [Gluconacetobacter sacchari DSM 12717]|uniref:TonB-dependent receptor n=2 Tax=Gluconacetobacter sacchari TaxID=92759 RepID=A0A7W4NQA0_9PROT|nr:TonB-dependent receptor [Gluconacetobacter sacchari]MBB2158910.1 TonB-dependent receptor [Gluconacetobacter sacchari]GBQ23473.1 TonB-dependent receptor [Gluconacetobacter sacchari DSM 12717]
MSHSSFPHARFVAALLASTGIALSLSPASAHAQARRFDIDSMPVSRAAIVYGRQVNMQIMLREKSARNIQAHAVHGVMSDEQALSRLLAGTGLVVQSRHDSVLILTPGHRGVSVQPAGERIVVSATHDTMLTKRTSDQIFDTLSAEQIRSAPDLTVVEAARRMVGISTLPSQNDGRSDNQMENVTIRGLDNSYNLITLDGAQLASADNVYSPQRGMRLDLIPSSLVGELQILKTIDAYDDPQGLGGQVHMLSKNAYEYGNSADIQLLGGWSNRAGTVVAPRREDWRVDGTITRVFGGNRQFGLVLAGGYQELNSAAHAILPGDSAGDGWTYYGASGAAQGSSINTDAAAHAPGAAAVPVRVQDYAFDDAYRRYSLNGKFQWRPTSRLSMAVAGGYFHAVDQEVRNEALSMPSGNWIAGATPDTGTLTQGQYQFGDSVQPEVHRTFYVNGTLHYDITNRMKLDLVAADSEAWDHLSDWMFKWNTGMKYSNTGNSEDKTSYSPLYGYNYTVNDGAPSIYLNDLAAANTLSNYGPRYFRDYEYALRTKLRFLRGDWHWDLGRGFWLGAGATQTMTNVQHTETYDDWAPLAGNAPQEIGNLGGYITGRTGEVTSAPGLTYYYVDPVKAHAILTGRPDLFRKLDETPVNKESYYHLMESITALYFQTGWRNDWFAIHGGFRWDHTFLNVANINAVSTGGATQYLPQTRTAQYDYLLPSVLTTFSITPRMKVRADFTESMGRPNYNQIGGATTTSESNGTYTISQGNSNLKPLHSWNYDLAYEWYPGRDTLVSLGLFYKDIHDSIYTRNTLGEATLNGITEQAIVSQPLNASGAGLRGLEMQLVREKFGFLPAVLRNFGVSFNATFLQGWFDEQMSDGSERRMGGLANQPRHIYNASLLYSDRNLEARFAYNLTGKYLYYTSGTASWLDMWMQPRAQIDMQVSYHVNRWMSVTGQVQNLTDAGYQTRMGPSANLIQDMHPVGRTVWFGIRFQPRL